MNFSRHFIDRPVQAAVLSILMIVAGLLALGQLPLTEYPQVTPPTVMVRGAYPGANPTVIAETVAAPIEQELAGLDGLLYMSSQSTGDGYYALTLTFAQGIDPEMAQVEVQNRVGRALPRLPAEVQRQGLVTQKTTPNLMMVVHLVSPGQRYDALHLSNYATLRVKDELAKIAGIDEVVIWGAGDYALRVWLDPERLAARGLTAGDVATALREQNAQIAAGALGQSPDGATAFQVAVDAKGRLADLDEFAAIVVATGPDGALTRLGDIARVELGSNRYALRSLLDGEPAVPIALFQSNDSSALEVAAAVRATMARLAAEMPQGIEHRIAYDPTLFVQASIDNVIRTLFEALLLVVLVVLLFLKTWRATLIPLAAVPVSLIGTLAAMHGFGFTLNTLSLFGLVLSIGIVVDDAIVVVENVERHIAKGLKPRDAAYAAMKEVTGPIIAITSVLVAVFVPTAFLSGLTGQFYAQFALTIAISTVLSAINSLTLSPALAALLLQPHGAPTDRVGRALERGLGWAFRPFDRAFDALGLRYIAGARRVLRIGGIVAAVWLGLVALTALGFQKVPAGFVPAQDKYYLVGIVQLPSGSSLDRTEAVLKEMDRIARTTPGVESVVSFPGLSIDGFITKPSAGVMFVMLDPFEQRDSPELSAGALAGALNGKYAALAEGFIGVFPPPPVPGLGNLGGFKLQVQDRDGQGFAALHQVTWGLVAKAWADPRLAGVFSNFQIDVPQAFVEVDREKAKAAGVPLASVNEALQANLGSMYVNDFNLFGRTWQVYLQADAAHRREIEDIGRLHARNAAGEMVPLAALAEVRLAAGPDPVTRYDAFPSAAIMGGPAPGVSSGQAVAAIEELAAANLPDGFTLVWTDLTYQEKKAGAAGLLVFPLAVLFAYLILAAQYESWTLPLAVLASVPTVLLSALAGVWLTDGDNNVFTQIGFIVLVGLATKNAILIVEFARSRERDGLAPRAAVLEAAQLRLRPILMTSLAFVMGVVPLVLASGAGAEMRQAMGIAVFAGMIGVTLFGLFLTPAAYVLIRERTLARDRARAAAAVTEVSHA